MKPDNDLRADVLLVTVNKIEARAVLGVFEGATDQKAKPVPIEDKVYHDLGTIKNARVFMVQSRMGTGGLGASLLTVHKGVEAHEPSAVIAVGIAFGANKKKQAIGDVLVSAQIANYEPQRVGKRREVIAKEWLVAQATWRTLPWTVRTGPRHRNWLVERCLLQKLLAGKNLLHGMLVFLPKPSPGRAVGRRGFLTPDVRLKSLRSCARPILKRRRKH